MKKYRLYIDESGSPNLNTNQSSAIAHKYLCLLGIIIKNDNYKYLSEKWEEMRGLFLEDVDDKPIFHYTDVVAAKKYFAKLKTDIKIKEQFNELYLDFCYSADISLISVTLDKNRHFNTYKDIGFPAYGYCLEVLLERYVRFLQEHNATGDIMIEQRGRKEDRALQSHYASLYASGTKHASLKSHISSKELKIRRKEDRIVGLEISDMLATAIKHYTLAEYAIIPSLNDNFTLKVINKIKSKIKADADGSIKGYGIKML